MWQMQEHMIQMSAVTWFVFSTLSMISVFRTATSYKSRNELHADTDTLCSSPAINSLYRFWCLSRGGGVSHAVIKEKVLTYLSFALNQGWHKDGHLVRVWQWKTPDSSVTHIEAKRSFSCIQFHSTERNSLLSKLDTSSCGAVPQCIAWCAPPAQSEFKRRLTFSADRQSFLKTSHLSSVWQDTGSCVSADVVWQIFFLGGGWVWLTGNHFFNTPGKGRIKKKEKKRNGQ